LPKIRTFVDMSASSFAGADLAGPGTFGRLLDLEVDLLSLAQGLEGDILQRAAMEENLLAVVAADEPESSIFHESLDLPGRHPRSPLPL
jgi:hypothetical protein